MTSGQESSDPDDGPRRSDPPMDAEPSAARGAGPAWEENDAGSAGSPTEALGDADGEGGTPVGPDPGAASDRGGGDGDAAGLADDDSPLRDESDDDTPAGPQGDDGDQVAFDARLAGISSSRGGSLPSGFAFLSGRYARQYQATTMNIYEGSPGTFRPPSGPLSAQVLEDVRAGFVGEESYHRLLDGLGRRRFKVLVGEPGYGRTTTALNAVIDHLALTSGDLAGRVYLVETTEPERFDVGQFRAASGVVLLLSPGVPAPSLAWITQVTGRLKEDAVLVVVTTASSGRSSPLEDAYRVVHRAPAPKTIFAKHLGTRVDAGAAREIGRRKRVVDEVARLRRPREAAGLAAELAAGWREGREPEDVLDSRRPAEPIEKVLDELHNGPRWQRAYLFSGAVLDGIPAGVVTRQASLLVDLMAHGAQSGVEAEGTVGESGRTPLPSTDVADWSECVRLETSPDGRSRVVRLAHRALYTTVVETVWQEHIPLRDAVLAWLRALGGQPDVRVRVKAAQAVAHLATYDFEVIRNEVLRPWADGGRPRCREAAAWALEALSFRDDRRYAARVRGLIREWTQAGDICRQAAGITAYGTFLGFEDPQEALNRMAEVVDARQFRLRTRRGTTAAVERDLAGIVERAIIEIFRSGQPETVITTMAAWTRSGSWRRWQCAAGCLVRLTRLREPDADWPILLQLADQTPHLTDDLAALWREALDRLPRRTTIALYEIIQRAEDLLATYNTDTGPATSVNPTAAADPGIAAESSGGDRGQVDAVRFRAVTHQLLSDLCAGDEPSDERRRRRVRFQVAVWEHRLGRPITIIPTALRQRA